MSSDVLLIFQIQPPIPIPLIYSVLSSTTNTIFWVCNVSASIIESVDSISRVGPDKPIYVIQYKKLKNSAQIRFYVFKVTSSSCLSDFLSNKTKNIYEIHCLAVNQRIAKSAKSSHIENNQKI